MSYKYAELRRITLDKLIQEHDEAAGHANVGINYYLDEIARRDAERQTRTMLTLTWVIAFLTVINVAALAWQVGGGGH
jgi:hypothetical protein